MLSVVLLLALCSGITLAYGDEPESPDPEDAALSAPPGVPGGPELEGKRTATSQTFLLPDGSHETRIYEAPINYRDEGGDWQPIDESFEELDGGRLINGANSFDVSLPEHLGADPVRLSIGDAWVTTELLGAEPQAVQAEEVTASYESAGGGTSFEFANLADGLKEDIVIADPSQPRSFHFDLDASAGLTPTLEGDGSVEFRNEAEETTVLLPAPVVTDAAGVQGAGSVKYTLQAAAEGHWRLAVEVDPDWLASPQRSWPARIDPTLTVPSPMSNCTFSGSKGTNISTKCASATQKELVAKYHPSTTEPDSWSRSALRFNVNAIPDDAYIANATVGLRAPAAALNTSGVELLGLRDYWTNAVSWLKYDSSHLWSKEGGAYPNEKPGAEILTSQRGSQAGWWLFSSISLGEEVKNWVEAEEDDENYGLLIKLRDDQNRECSGSTCTERKVAFDASTVTETANRPYLKVLWYQAAPAQARMKSPAPRTVTGRWLTLKSSWGDHKVTGVTYQYRMSGGPWEIIPPALTKNSQGQPVSWPMTVEGKESAPIYFDALNSSQAAGKAGGVQIRALFDGPTGENGYSAAVDAVIDPKQGNSRDATAQVGPGSLDLLTGKFSLSQTDASIPALDTQLSFSRTSSSTGTGSDISVMGRGWEPSMPLESAGGSPWGKARDLTVEEEDEDGEIHTTPYTVLTDEESYEIAFERSGESYVTPPEASGWQLSRVDATHIALSEPGATKTTFELTAGTSEYLPTSVTQLGGTGNRTRLVYQLVSGNKRLSMVIGPVAPGVSCETESAAMTTPGCRSLKFNYVAATTWKAPASFKDRLASVTYYGPASATEESHWDVAQYNYDAQGRLTEAWDPRPSSPLKTLYTYTEAGSVKTLTPPGLEPWTFTYDEQMTPEGLKPGPLLSASRPSLVASPSIAKTSIAYDVPLSGSGAPYDMSAASVAKWGQQDLPMDATAVFPADDVPSSPPSSYSRATLYYMDVEGQLVNTATPAGAGTASASISTAETDEFGNVVRELSAQNRLRALAAGSGSVARSHELETQRVFSSTGLQLLQEWGPMHQTRLESGSSVQARLHRTIKYEDSDPSPAGTPPLHPPILETTGAAIVGQADADQRVSEFKYDWTLRKQTDVIVDPTGLNLRTHTSFDPQTGLPTERSLPANPSGGDAHTTKTTYYSAGASGPCPNKPGWAGLRCETLPAAQPGTSGLPDLLASKVKAYSPLGQPTLVYESPAGEDPNRRTTTVTYDAAGRQTTSKISGGGVPVPKSETLYSSTTGLPTTQRFVCEASCAGFDDQAVTTTYDTHGRVTSFQDADGNNAKTTYDLLGRPVTTEDGKGTQTRTYDSVTGLLTGLQDSAAGSFTASYNADGAIVEQGLPNGVVAKTTYDETGVATHLSYVKTMCSVSCTWLDFNSEESIYGQVLAQTSTLSSQQYSYDKAGRLTQTLDTPQGGSCVTREYVFGEPGSEEAAGKDSNRTKLITRNPGLGKPCDTTSAGSTQSYSYDAADRLLGTGLVYDNFGRIKLLPAGFAGGKALSTDYFSNDMVAEQSQNGVTNTFQLDAMGRQRQRLQGGGLEGAEVFHYAGTSDSPSWTARGSSWTRNVIGIGGELAAIQDSSSGVALQLSNLHGDVVGTASLSQSATKPTATFEFDEFGNPKQAGSMRFGWLGGKQRRTELPSGVIQMGARSYVPTIGRFLTPDPVFGGSANSYDYAYQDPVNGLDLNGEWAAPPWVVRKRARSRAAEAGISTTVVRRRTCTAIACHVTYGDSKGGPIDSLINKAANSVVKFLSTHVDATVQEAKIFGRGIIAGASRDESRRTAACAEAAAVGWQETTPTRGLPYGGLAASILFTTTVCAAAAAGD